MKYTFTTGIIARDVDTNLAIVHLTNANAVTASVFVTFYDWSSGSQVLLYNKQIFIPANGEVDLYFPLYCVGYGIDIQIDEFEIVYQTDFRFIKNVLETLYDPNACQYLNNV